jgi:hypothetical protein
MKPKICILFLITAMCFLSTGLYAQKDNDYTKKEKSKKEREEAINTNKKTPVKIIEHIVGTWQVDGIYKGNKDISDSDTVGLQQVIEFNREGRYVSHSGSEKIDSGSYRLNENHALLYLESETGEAPKEWNVSFAREGMMTLQPKGSSAHAQSFKYVYTRTSTGDKDSN